MTPDAARALFKAALHAAGIRFEPADLERLAAEFEDHVQDGRVIAEVPPPDAEPLPSVREGW
jgi:hypothetical protein